MLPNYALGMGMADVYSNYQGNQYCSAIPHRQDFCTVLDKINMTNPCCKGRPPAPPDVVHDVPAND